MKFKIARSDDGVQHDVTVTVSVGSVFAPEDWEMGKRIGDWSFYADPEFDFGTSEPVASAESLSALREKLQDLIDSMDFSGKITGR